MGEKAEVLEPQELRKEMKKRITNMFNYYKIARMDRNKGSYKRMRLLIREENTHLLEKEKSINDTLQWICPTLSDSKENQLNSSKILNEFKISAKDFEGFWPKRQPQWDGIAYSKKTRTIYLFEAKSHRSEIRCGNKLDDSNNEKKQKNYDLKCNSLRNAMMEVVKNSDYEKAWLHKYYQISNRITFLLKLKSICPTEKIKDVKLIFLNFVNDPDWVPANKQMSFSQWEEKYKEIYKSMGLTKSRLNELGAFVINFDSEQMKE